MKLYIAEKPSLGRTVAKHLGNGRSIDGAIQGTDWIVTWCFGHLYEPIDPDKYNPAWKKWNLDDLPMIPDAWKLAPRNDAKAQIKVIQNLLKDADTVVNVGDPDREGQLLIDEVLHEAKWSGNTERLWITDQTDKGLKKAFSDIRQNDDFNGLYQSAIARQRADWLVGMNLTRAYTINARKSGYDGVLSVGRVQTPTLSLVVDRDNRIDNFVSVPFYEIDATFEHENGEYVGKLLFDDTITDPDGRLLDRNVADILISDIERLTSGTISDLDKKKQTKNPPLCFSLTDLQATASKKYGMTVDKVLNIAQSLYETHKLTTYPRSDSGFLAENQLDDAPAIFESLNLDLELSSMIDGADTTLKSKVWNDKKVAAAAHTGIIPTGDCSNLSNLNDQELAIFRLIAQRYIIQFYPPNVVEKTTFNTALGELSFRSSGTITVDDGWKAVYADDDDDDSESTLIDVSNCDSSTRIHSELVSKKTSPPKRFTEATLVLAMENIAKYITESDDKEAKATLRDVKGIGTVATRGNIVEGLKSRGFLEPKGRSILSTARAKDFIALLPDSIKSPITTAEWEQRLSTIEKGSLSADDFTAAQVAYITESITGLSSVQIAVDPDAIKCPTCGEGVLRRRKGKYGMFWGCSRFSDGCKAVFKDNRGKPILEKKTATQSSANKYPEKACPHLECDGKAKRFQKRNKKAFFWICNTCDDAGRNKFLNDVRGVPVIQE